MNKDTIDLEQGLAIDFPAPFGEFISDLACLGVKPSSQGDEFAVICARSNSRWWLLPLGKAHAFRSGLEMYQPISRVGKLAKTALRIATYTTPSKIWARNRIVLSGRLDVTTVFSQNNLNVSYFTGTEGPHRKTSVQVMDQDSNILGYAKVSQQKNVRDYIEKEAQALKFLSNLNLQTCTTPSLLDFRKTGRACYLVTDTRRTTGTTIFRAINARHIAFLREIAQKTGTLGAQQPFSELRDFCEKAGDWLPEDWKDRFGSGLAILEGSKERISVCMAHGDFTPWNCFALTDGLYIFDWEYATTAPVGSDLVHFILSTRQGQSAKSLVERIRHSVTTTLYDGDVSSVDYAILLSLLMHAAFYLNRLQEVGKNASAWLEAPFRASIIDCLLEQMFSSECVD